MLEHLSPWLRLADGDHVLVIGDGAVADAVTSAHPMLHLVHLAAAPTPFHVPRPSHSFRAIVETERARHPTPAHLAEVARLLCPGGRCLLQVDDSDGSMARSFGPHLRLDALATPFAVTTRAPLERLSDVDWSRWIPRDRATLVFIVDEERDRVLLIDKKRGLGAGKVNAPGGRIEPGETALAGAIREVQEELHVTPEEVTERGHLAFQFADGYGLSAHVFLAKSFTGEPTETDEARPRWTGLRDIPYARMWSDDALWLPMLLRGERFAGRFVFDRDAMLDHAFDDPNAPV